MTRLSELAGTNGSAAAERRFALLTAAWRWAARDDNAWANDPEVTDWPALRSSVEQLGQEWVARRIGVNSPWRDRTGHAWRRSRRYRPADVRAVLAAIDRHAPAEG